MTVAADHYVLQLQVGRFLRGKWLILAILLREIPLMVASSSSGSSGLVAPSWVLINSRSTGQLVARVAAGREAGAGSQLLAAMQRDAGLLSANVFLDKWTERDS